MVNFWGAQLSQKARRANKAHEDATKNAESHGFHKEYAKKEIKMTGCTAQGGPHESAAYDLGGKGVAQRTLNLFADGHNVAKTGKLEGPSEERSVTASKAPPVRVAPRA